MEPASQEQATNQPGSQPIAPAPTPATPPPVAPTPAPAPAPAAIAPTAPKPAATVTPPPPAPPTAKAPAGRTKVNPAISEKPAVTSPDKEQKSNAVSGAEKTGEKNEDGFEPGADVSWDELMQHRSKGGQIG